MARTVRDAALETRAARARLKARGKPYYRTLDEGLHLGYRKGVTGGKWVVRHYVGDETYTVETIATADDAADPDGLAILSYKQAQAAARERMVRRAHGAAGKHGPLKVMDAIDAYLTWLADNRRTAADARYRASAFIYPSLGELEIESLKADRLRRWHADLAKSPPRLRTKPGEAQKHREHGSDDESKRRRRSSANRTLTILKAALNRVWRDGKVSSDAAWRRVQPFESVDAARVRYLTVEEARRLINVCDPAFRPLVEAALVTGCRYGELTRLQNQDYSREAGTLAIRHSKSGRPRHVILTEEGAALFDRLTAGREGSRLAFTRINGGAWLKSHQIRRIADACERARITPPVGFHQLRHTWASLAVMKGVPLLVVARNLGHADTRMVERHYGHLSPSFVAEAIRAGAPRFGLTASNVTRMGARP